MRLSVLQENLGKAVSLAIKAKASRSTLPVLSKSLSSTWTKPLPPPSPKNQQCEICDKPFNSKAVIECDDGIFRCGRCRARLGYDILTRKKPTFCNQS